MAASLLADFPLLLVAVALALHVVGERRAARLRRRPRDRRARLQSLSFYAGLVTIAISLEGPIDTYAAKLFWVHMIQHVLMLTVAAPLIVLGAPWNSVWRPLPLGLRRSVAGTIAKARWTSPLRAIGHALGSPTGAFLAFSIDLMVWHIPGAYNLTLQHVWVHALEHTTFMLVGILLWSQVIDSPPLHGLPGRDHRVYYMVGASAVGWLLSLVLAFAPSPLYSVYAHMASRPGGISALTDQQLAGGVMLGPGSVPMLLFVFFGLYRWLGSEESGSETAVVAHRRSTAGSA